MLTAPDHDASQPNSRSMVERLRDWARSIKRDVHALYLAARDPRVPWYAKAVALAVAAYALSPIDLIPDFIPVHRLSRRPDHRAARASCSRCG